MRRAQYGKHLALWNYLESKEIEKLEQIVQGMEMLEKRAEKLLS